MIDGKLFERAELTQRGHSEKILDMLDAVLAEAGVSLADIDVVAFGRGPGSFTGVRVGVGVAQGIAFARQLPVAPVSSLAAVAQNAIDHFAAEKIVVAMDARMGEVYTAKFVAAEGLAKAVSDEVVCKPEKLVPTDKAQWFAAGTGWDEFEAVLLNNFGAQIDNKQTLFPTAACIAKLAADMANNGQTIPAHQAVPVYLRDNVAKKKGEQ